MLPLAGGFVIAGFADSFGAGGMDAWSIRTDPSGRETRKSTYGGPKDEFGWAIAATDDGGLLPIGCTRRFGAGDWDAYPAHLDASGNEQ